MARITLGSLSLALCLGVVAVAQQPGSKTVSTDVKLADCKVFVHHSSGTLVATHGDQCYFGTAEHVVSCSRGDATQKAEHGWKLKFTEARSEGKPGLLLYCSSGDRFYVAASESDFAKMPNGAKTVAALCSSHDACKHVPMPCEPKEPGLLTIKPASPKSNGADSKKSQKIHDDSNVIQAGAKFATAPGLTLIEGERVKPDEAMIFTRSILIEEGQSVAAMSRLQENITNVRYNMNTYRLGYALPATKNGDRWVFNGQVKGWRATSTGDVSVWPPSTYRVSRDEAMRRAKLLKPIAIAEELDEMNNLRVYYLPSLVGHDGRQYKIEHSVLAFFIHPKTGYRMTVMLRAGRTYGAVNKPVAATSNIYVQDTEVYSVGPFGLGQAHVPSVFYSKKVDFDMEPFAEGDALDRLMNTALESHLAGPLAAADFKALSNELARYTGGKTE